MPIYKEKNNLDNKKKINPCLIQSLYGNDQIYTKLTMFFSTHCKIEGVSNMNI